MFASVCLMNILFMNPHYVEICTHNEYLDQ